MLAVWQGAAPHSTEDTVDMAAKWGFYSVPVLQYRPSIGKLGGVLMAVVQDWSCSCAGNGRPESPSGLH